MIDVKEVQIYDTTLRDGVQGLDVTVSLSDMLALVRRLDRFGVHYIELGWPGANLKSTQAFDEVQKEDLKYSDITAFGMTRRKGISPEDDANLTSLIRSKAQIATIFGKTWKLHVYEVLETTPEENLNMIYDSVRFLKGQPHVKKVIFDAEHFYDGYNDDAKYALQCLDVAKSAGADMVVLCDTNGGTLTTPLRKITEKTIENLRIPVGIHAHNDSGVAVANSIAAVEAGASQVQGTINGIGERTGNADLVQVIPNLQMKMGMKTVKSGDLTQLTELAKYVYDITHTELLYRQPYVSRVAFTHKGGVHGHAVMKNPKTYEHIPPEAVGNLRNIVGSEAAGKENFIQIAKSYGIDLTDKQATNVAREVKRRESVGYQFEKAEANLFLSILSESLREFGRYTKPFVIRSWRSLSQSTNGEKAMAEGTIKLELGDVMPYEAAEGTGTGPVHALDNAIRKSLVPYYPEIEMIHLKDYKVEPVDIIKEAASDIRVSIKLSDGFNIWSSQGVSANIIEASKEALEVGYQFFFLIRKYSPTK